MTKRVPLGAMILLLGVTSHPTSISAAPPEVAGLHPTKQVATDTARAANQTPAPGLYAAIPFSAIVVVPAENDSHMIVDPPNRLAQSRIIHGPPVTLVPLHR